jgi:hypothetical protein
VVWGTIGVIVDVEERPALLGTQSWVRARFGDFITPWIEEWRLEQVRQSQETIARSQRLIERLDALLARLGGQ